MRADDPKVLRAVRTPHQKVSHRVAGSCRSLRGFAASREFSAFLNGFVPSERSAHRDLRLPLSETIGPAAASSARLQGVPSGSIRPRDVPQLGRNDPDLRATRTPLEPVQFRL